MKTMRTNKIDTTSMNTIKAQEAKNVQGKRISREEAAAGRIRDLYEQAVRTGSYDTDYRAKILHELLLLQKEDGSFSVIDNYRVDTDIRIS